jgi:SAM-dependent methyltransferase
MKEHIKAWNNEYKQSIWKGHYSLEILESRCAGRLLDAGCGSGKYAIPLRYRGYDVLAVDASQKALKMAEERCMIHKLDIDLLAANVYLLPFKDASFDVVWCYGVMQHLLSNERKLAVNEFKRLLRKEGLLFLEVFGEDDMRYGGKEIEPGTFSRNNGIIYHYFNRRELEELLQDFSCQIFESHKRKRFNGVVHIRHMISAVAKNHEHSKFERSSNPG